MRLPTLPPTDAFGTFVLNPYLHTACPSCGQCLTHHGQPNGPAHLPECPVLLMVPEHDPTGRGCALAGRAVNGHDVPVGDVCRPCYEDALRTNYPTARG